MWARRRTHGLGSFRYRSSSRLRWRGPRNTAFHGSASEVVVSAATTLDRATFCFKRFYLAPDYLVTDLGTTSPSVRLPEADDILSRLLALDLNPARNITHKRQTDLGWNTTDWVGLNRRNLLFCDTGHYWPTAGRVQRSSRRRSHLIWRLYSIVELVKMNLLWVKYLINASEHAVLEMKRATNRSKDFLANLLKATYYDDRIVTLAMDFPKIRTQLYGRDLTFYDYFAGLLNLPDEERRLSESMKQFHSAVDSWKPTALRILDLLKLVPTK